MLLGAVGANVEAENVSTIRITVAQWGQRRPVMGVAVGWCRGVAGGEDGEAAVDREGVSWLCVDWRGSRRTECGRIRGQNVEQETP